MVHQKHIYTEAILNIYIILQVDIQEMHGETRAVSKKLLRVYFSRLPALFRMGICPQCWIDCLHCMYIQVNEKSCRLRMATYRDAVKSKGDKIGMGV